MIDLKNLKLQIGDKPIAILGLGKSGFATFEACKAAGIETILWDDNPQMVEKAKRSGANIEDLNEANFLNFSMLCLAPGIPFTYPKPHPVIDRALTACCQIVCDIELFYLANKTIKTIGITGTNGKSTTTALIGYILKEAGIETAIGGNIGEPILSLPQLSDKAIYVLELSSYQLDLCQDYAPDISVLTNITPDHLERHGSMQGYILAKKRIFRNGGVAIVSIDERHSSRISKQLEEEKQREVIAVSCNETLNNTVYIDQEGIAFCQGKKLIDLNDCESLQGKHNWQNAAMAIAVCISIGMEKYKIVRALESFSGLKHRQTIVARWNNITYINDSKATNDVSASMALKTYNNIYWIAGGKDKGCGYNNCERFVKNIKQAFLIGEAAEEIAEMLAKNNIEYSISKTLDEALIMSKNIAEKDNLEDSVILFSPACASFDQFKNFEHRGDVFTDMVNNIISKNNINIEIKGNIA